ncbi:MAG: molybdopterin-dependent oxidoreductase [Rhodothermales bacterium]|nr:molybdopterin-dependent oxidoreductase [Rhodothermales bacterium]
MKNESRSRLKAILKSLQQINNTEIKEGPKTADPAFGKPEFSIPSSTPEKVDLTTVIHPDGRMSQYPPDELWDDWTEYSGKDWPKKTAGRYRLIPTVCFNCESACGLLAYVDHDTYEIKKFEGNPAHPGSRGRNCAKGPASINQVYDPERLLYPLKRVGNRGEGKWERISWNQALEEIGEKMRASRQKRRDGIMYHVGRPGEDGYTNRCIQAWGVDGHNSHTNICSAGARAGYSFWTGGDRPSPDYANARVVLLISSHLETGHYFNPHAQRIMEAKEKGAKLITLDPRLSNTASKSDVWLPTWPGSEQTLLLAIANYLIQNDLYDKKFVKRWVNWKETLEFLRENSVPGISLDGISGDTFEDFDALLKNLYAEFTIERAAEEAQVSVADLTSAAEYIGDCDGRLAAHTWRSASIGNLGGWQVARCLFFLNVLTGSVGNRGGTSINSWNKFVPEPFSKPPAGSTWNELHLPHEWPLAFYEMSFLLPHFLEEGRGDIDVYFTRVYNPMWINPDGFTWLQSLVDEDKIKCHVALTPTWNETAWFADYVLPMGHSGERHDLMSQETHSGQWLAFRQPVRRVAMEKAGRPIQFTYEANPGEVWEENEFWIELSVAMDPDGSLGVRQYFESPYRPGEIVTVREYYRWIFENSVPGLPDAATAKGLTPYEYMRKYGAFEVVSSNYKPFEAPVSKNGQTREGEAIASDGKRVGLVIEGEGRKGFPTPSGKLEFLSPTLFQWGWSEKQFVIPWTLKSHVHPDFIDPEKGEMLLLPNFRLPTLIHTRSANAKWLYELSHKNPVWINPIDARRLGVESGGLVRVETEIGYFVDVVWVTEGIKPGVIAMSHHLGRWRLKETEGVNRQASNKASLTLAGNSGYKLEMEQPSTRAFSSWDPDTERIWWKDVGVHQNLTHAVHPDPISGAHCWLQKATNVSKAGPEDKHGDVFVDVDRSMEVYREWVALTRSANTHSPDGTRRPHWLKRPLKPTKETYKLNPSPFKTVSSRLDPVKFPDYVRGEDEA